MEKENKKLITFIAIAYVLNFLMAIPMYIGKKAGADISVFATVQMMYPACGVILGMLLFDKNIHLPKGAFITVLLTGASFVVLCFVSIAYPMEAVEINGLTIEPYALYSQYLLMAFSIIAYILFWTCGKERRANAGLSHKNIKASILMVILYLVLYSLRIVLSFLLDQLSGGDTVAASLSQMLANFQDPSIVLALVTLPLTFFLAFLPFFGEEYGWRYYLQGILMNKFGKRAGAVILGVLWGLWHIPLDFIYYTSDSGPQMLTNQIIVCIGFGIFYAYAYMKTENMWVPIIMHFANNNLIPIVTGNLSTDVLENRTLGWEVIPQSFVLTLIFIVFIFAKEFKENKEA